MNNYELVYNYLKNTNIIQKRNRVCVGCTTSTIARALNISRANVSTILNNMYKEGKVIKSNSRPILYSHVNNEKSTYEISLDNFLANYDLNTVMITRAKTAMSHPPHGLNVCLVGEIGVGKLFFAKLMHNYACEEGIFTKNSPFITVDCTKYVYNNSKLLKKIFGITKEQNTVDKTSLIFKASGGIIFLEEAHLLSEKFKSVLFEYMRNGYITGFENSYNEITNVKFICACVGSKSNYYIRSFSDMFPISIELPPMRKITLDDKFAYINLFFQLESEHLNKKIIVELDVMECFLLYNCIGNMAQLQKDIRTTCFYANYKNSSDNITIDIKLLDSKVKQGLYHYKLYQESIEKVLDCQDEFTYTPQDAKYNLEYYITHNNRNTNDARFSELNLKRSTTDNSFNDVEFNKFLDKRVVKITRFIIDFAQENLDKKYSKRTFYSLATHINDIKNSINLSLESENVYIMNRLKNEYTVISETAPLIYKQFKFLIPKAEYAQIAIILSTQYDENNYNDLVPPVIVAMHGYSIASSIVETVKQLMDIENIHALDIHLDKSDKIIYNEIKQLIKNTNYNKGLLVLTDLLSTNEFISKIKQELQIQITVIENTSIPQIVEYAQRLDQYRDIDSVTNFMKKKPNLIIIASYANNNNILEIKKYLTNNINQTSNIKIINSTFIDKTDFEILVTSYQNIYNVLVVSNIEEDFSFVKNLQFSKTIINEIYDFFNIKVTINNTCQEIYQNVYKSLEKNYSNINFKVLIPLLDEFILSIEKLYNTNIHCDIGVGIVCHICATIAAIKNQRYMYKKINSISNQQQQVMNLFALIEKECDIIFSEVEATIIDNIMTNLKSS